MQKITIIEEASSDKPFFVISKPKGLPSAPLSSTDFDNALYQLICSFPQLKNVSGKKDIEYGLLHRLDTETEGLLLVAANQSFYDFMQIEQKEGRFLKTYQAQCEKDLDNSIKLEAFPPREEILLGRENQISSYFRNYGQGLKSVRPVTEKSGKAALKKIGNKKIYTTKIIINKNLQAKCTISQGYRHQVRCHLAWTGFPIFGDKLYNSSYKNDQELKFKATELSFSNPIKNLREIYTLS